MRIFCLSLGLIALLTCGVYGQKAKTLVGNVPVGEVSNVKPRQMPVFLWGGEGATFWANGGKKTTPNSIFGKLKLNYQLVDGNDPIQQARDYLSGKSPFFRGTFQQGSLFAELFSQDPRTKPVMILQLTYSLGDHMVYKEPDNNINQDGSIKKPTQLQDLKNRKIRIAAQEGGPHIAMIDGSLKAGGMTWNDVQMVWTKNLTGPDSPAEKLQNGECDIACLITPDMIGVCSGIDSVGTGAEGTVLGARVINTTAVMSRAIADVYLCRSDFFKSHRDEVEKFVIGYLQATEEVVKARKAYEGGKTDPRYQKMMEQMQAFFGKVALPTIEEDVHGMLLDANFVRVPGNEIFFKDLKNKTGFAAKQTASLAVAKSLGYINQLIGFQVADWDYKKISSNAGIKYTKPVYSSGRIKAEVTDFMEDLDDNTIFSFNIYFSPNETEFPIESYGDKFKTFCESQAAFGNSAVIIEGHGDPTLALKHFYWSAKAKGLLTGKGNNIAFNGRKLTLQDTDNVISAIQSTNLAGAKRVNKSGNQVAVPDPRETVAAALLTSQVRAKNAKLSIEKFAKENGYQIDLDAVFPRGVGISNPEIPKPTNMNEASKNMRVVLRVVKVQAEAISEDDFDFDN